MSGVAAPVQVAVKGINDADFKRSKAIMATQQGKGLAFPNQTEGKVQGPITDQQYRKAKESKVDYGIYEVKQTLEGQPTPLGVRVNFYVSLADSAFWAKDEATGIHQPGRHEEEHDEQMCRSGVIPSTRAHTRPHVRT
jgi:hypothetical protein